ncbi:protein ripply3 [Rhinophrynus dorsalis]
MFLLASPFYDDTFLWKALIAAHSSHFYLFSNPALWRPWVLSAEDRELETQQRPSGETHGDQSRGGSKGAHGFQHPVRLYMPKSKTNEYLQHMGKKVLASFPVQATIHFYNDDSDSEEEEDDYEMECYDHYQDCIGNPQTDFGDTVEENSCYTRLSMSQEKEKQQQQQQ